MERNSSIILEAQEEQISNANVTDILSTSSSTSSSFSSSSESADTQIIVKQKSTNFEMELEEHKQMKNIHSQDDEDSYDVDNNQLTETESSREMENGSDYHSCSPKDLSNDNDSNVLKAEKNDHKYHVKNIGCDDILTNYSYVSEDSFEYRPGGYHPVAVGDCLHQHYYAISKLGWGHYSTVWLCFDTKRECYSAIKIVKSAEQYAESARHEIRLLRHISQLKYHPWRDRVINFNNSFSTSGSNGTHECLVFDVLGDNMLMLIQRSCYRGLPLFNVKQIAKQVLQGLSMLHTHARIIHTDLKPENVLLATDDLSLRLLANEASDKYLMEQRDPELLRLNRDELTNNAKLSKTAKRRLRAKSKKTIGFFETHRKWLRERGIADLVLLANYGLLTPRMAMDAVTGKLPFMPFDSPKIMSDEDLLEFEHVAKFVSKTGMKRARSWDIKTNSKILQLLSISRKKFMELVQKVVEMEPTTKTSHESKRRIKLKRLTNSSQRKRKTRKQPEEQFERSHSAEPNLNIIHRKDPALEPCLLKAVIADMGNSCFIDQHITEDIQTREYRAVEVILGAEYNTSADLWSAACLFWELATGEYLFEPSKYHDTASQDEVHIANIIETCGPIPQELVNKGTYSPEIFLDDTELINIKTLIKRSLDQILIERYNWSDNEAADFADFLMPMLTTDPDKRATALEASNHPWLNLEESPTKTYTK